MKKDEITFYVLPARDICQQQLGYNRISLMLLEKFVCVNLLVLDSERDGCGCLGTKPFYQG